MVFPLLLVLILPQISVEIPQNVTQISDSSLPSSFASVAFSKWKHSQGRTRNNRQLKQRLSSLEKRMNNAETALDKIKWGKQELGRQLKGMMSLDRQDLAVIKKEEGDFKLLGAKTKQTQDQLATLSAASTEHQIKLQALSKAVSLNSHHVSQLQSDMKHSGMRQEQTLVAAMETIRREVRAEVVDLTSRLTGEAVRQTEASENHEEAEQLLSKERSLEITTEEHGQRLVAIEKAYDRLRHDHEEEKHKVIGTIRTEIEKGLDKGIDGLEAIEKAIKTPTGVVGITSLSLCLLAFLCIFYSYFQVRSRVDKLSMEIASALYRQGQEAVQEEEEPIYQDEEGNILSAEDVEKILHEGGQMQ